MNRFVFAWVPMLMVASTAMAAPVEPMSLQEEREQIGRNMEEGRRQSGQELNAIRDGSVADRTDSPNAGQSSGASGMPATGNHQSPRNGSGRPGEQLQNDNGSSAAGNEPRRSIMRPQQPSAGQPSGGGGANGNASAPNGAATGGNGTSPGNGSATGGMGSGGTGRSGAAAGNAAGGQ